jgi:hypothetical protein
MRKRDRTFRSAALTILVLLSATIAYAQPSQPKAEAPPDQPLAATTQSLWNAYERAVYDSSVYQRWNVRPLRPLLPDANGQVPVAVLTSRDGKAGETITAGPFGMWVTGVPEVQVICRGFRGDIDMQLRELLGLPPSADTTRFLLLLVQAGDLFRPAPDDRISTRYPCKTLPDDTIPPDCGNSFPDTTSPSHYQWMATETFYLHKIPSGYPWTHLGYTYNWTPGADRYGASEYVIRANAKAVIVDNVQPARYCAPAVPVN